MNRTPPALLVLTLLVALLAGGLLWTVFDRLPSEPNAQILDAAAIGGPFALTDQNGARRTDRDFRGHYVLLYFGYSFCPDVCPTALGVIADALSKLGPKAKRIVPVFVTIDPERDTPAVLKKYVAAFGPDFVGLTGTLPQVMNIAREYRVYFAKHKLEGGSYAVDHSSVIYLVGPGGKLVTFYQETMTPDQLAKDLAKRV